MKFLCLISAPRLLEDMSPGEAQRHVSQYAALIARLKSEGQYRGGHRLLPPASAVTLRVRGGEVLETDGPFAEMKEQIGGFMVIEAANIEDAAKIAAQIPGAKLGSVEARPIAEDAATIQAMAVKD